MHQCLGGSFQQLHGDIQRGQKTDLLLGGRDEHAFAQCALRKFAGGDIDLQTEHERYLTEHIYKRPVFVTDYPKEIKAFYMRLNEDGKTVAAADCLVPGIGEIIGGSQREERLDVLEARIKELGMNPDDYKYYCDLRRYGSCRHAGYGLGFERMVMYLTGVNNIRDVELHPRTVGNADF